MSINSLPPVSRVLAVVVRHGRTAYNDPKRPKLRAWDNVPLKEEGQEDIQLTANKLKIYNPKLVYSSDLARDSQSAILIAEILGNIPFEIDYALRTADMGTLAGMLDEDAAPRVLRWYQNPGEPAPSGETRYEFEKRIWKFMEPKLDLARSVAAFRPVIFVTHGRVLAMLDSFYNMKLPEDGSMPFPGGFGVIRCNMDGVDTFELIGESEPVHFDT
jgi:broad specificity phosphatase PhoE